jgi:hypothetical protein
LYSLKADKDVATWNPIATPDFDFVALTGNAADGVSALVSANAADGEANLVISNANPGKDSWVLALVAAKETKSDPVKA